MTLHSLSLLNPILSLVPIQLDTSQTDIERIADEHFDFNLRLSEQLRDKWESRYHGLLLCPSGQL